VNKSSLVDFHCHLDLYPNHADAVEEAERGRVFTLAVTTTPRAWPRNYELTKDTHYIRAALGLHPQLVAKHHHELKLWEEYLPQTRYGGEVGLDASPRFYASFELQKDIFRRVLASCARDGGKIITVHSVRATKITLEMLQEHLPESRGKVVLHWFTGTKAQIKKAVALGYYFSINSEMLDDPIRRELVKGIPVDRLLTETDGPFTKTFGNPSKPVDVAHTIDQLAALHFLDPEEVKVIIRNNLLNLLALEHLTAEDNH
jgi:TatD DNase family protein